MNAYDLRSQDVSVALEFARSALSGSTCLVFTRRGGESPNATAASSNPDYEDQEHSGAPGDVVWLLPFAVPAVSHARYKRVTVNGADANFHFAKTLDPAGNAQIVNAACRNVDLMSLDGIHVAAQNICNALLCVELREMPQGLTVEIQFEFPQLSSASDDIFFQRHWLLPRCSTSYCEYTVFTTGAGSERWFPTPLLSKDVSIAPDCAYRIEASVPRGYTVVCGLPVDDEAGEAGGLTLQADAATFRFRWAGDQGLGVLSRDSFGLFAGDFELWDGVCQQNARSGSAEKGQQALEDEDCMEDFARVMPNALSNKVPVTYVTLRGFGFLLEPTNVATSSCLDTYRRVLDLETPGNLFLLFLPGRPFPAPRSLSAHIRTQNYTDIKRCTAYTGSENYLHMAFIEPLAGFFHDMYYRSGSNMIVYSMDVLHSYSDIDHDPRSLDCRIVVAYGLATLYTLRRWVNPSRDMHIDLMLQSYLVDQFVKRNMGMNEHRVRLWARREIFASFTEMFGDNVPLCQRRGVSASTQVLMSERTFWLKCHLLPAIVDSLFAACNFVPDNLLIQSMRRRLLALSKHRGGACCMDTNCGRRPHPEDGFATWSDGDFFWAMMRDEMIKRYINSWNARPPNRLVLENQLSTNCTLEDILRRGVEHDHLNAIMKQYNSLVRSFVHGTGCPQMNMGFSLQLQRKGTSMDSLSFRVDIKSLQPPLDVHKDGRTAYTVCGSAGLSVRNLVETYAKLARTLQLEEHSEEHALGSRGRVFSRVLQLFGVAGSDYCPSAPHALDFSDVSNPINIAGSSEAGVLRRNMGLVQMWHDSIDLVGRDGNFLMGFGYIGPLAHSFCLGNGPIYDSLEVLRQHCDINTMFDTYVDNGASYCGTYTYRNGYERIFGKGSLPVASNGGTSFWQLIHQQAVMMDLPNSSVPLSAGYSKQWIAPFKVDIVEDDGMRENVRVIGDLLPARYNVNPRAERGRKKVANKIVSDKDGEDLIDDPHRKSNYIGHHSESDRLVIEWMKILYIGIHPELAQLDNRSVVAKICSKLRLPVLWMSIDSGFRLIARIRRCQSGSMWEQQLLSDNNVFGQLDAAAALGSLGRSVHYTACENPVLRVAVTKLEMMVRRHRVHPLVRVRCLYSLVCLHNRDCREQEAVQDVFVNYLNSFSLNNTGANYWHPSEARFMLDFFRAVSLLRNRFGTSPQMAVDALARVLKGMNGVNYLVHATNIVECCSHLAIPPCALRHAEENSATCLQITALWLLLWHLFRLDGIPGSGSCNRVLTAAFLRCLSRQPLLLELCSAKFLNEKDLGFEFDFLHFIPLRQNVLYVNQAAFELGQTYDSKHVHAAAVEALMRVVMMGAFVVEDEESMEGEGRTQCMRMVKVDYGAQVERIRSFAGVYEATRCCVRLCELVTEASLVLDAWEAFGRLVEELAQSHPVLFLDLECPLALKTRNLLYEQLRPRAVSPHYFHVQVYVRIRAAIALLFGHGFAWEGDAAPEATLVSQRIDLLSAGLSMPRIAAFKRMHGEGARNGGATWIEVAVEAVNALKELPEARWFIHDPERSFVGYRSLVRHPMWLTKVEQKALTGQYAMPMQFKADMALIFKNAKSVNKADTMPFEDAKEVEKQFETLWPAIVRTFQRNAKMASGQ
ncbi:bromodomain containing protein, putative [Babesia caballi]|uniref:Bromodomain containing protein, putative n=1 Tax=Babesia caballi TaxID=5871 RepID=A0AAV4LX10_BABCB|nr:bromodomain containing protein, putative [Babesia caballi]